MNAKQQIAEFFGKQKYVYATPGSDNHTANFYGMDRICRLTRTDVLRCVEAASGWGGGDGQEYDARDLLAIVLGDLQLDRPE